MIWLWLRQLDARLCLLLPCASALCAALIDVLPLFGSGPWGLTPFSTLCGVYFWSLYRPDLFGASAAFASGIVYDALAGLPLGLTALTLVLTRQFVVVQRRFFVARSFLVVLSCFLLLAPAVESTRWLLACIWWGRLFPFEPIALSLVLTMALCPVVSVVLTRVDGRIPRLIDAP